MVAYGFSFYSCWFYHAYWVDPSPFSGSHFNVHGLEYEYPPAPIAVFVAWLQQCRAGGVACAIKTIPVAGKKMAESR